MLQAIDSTRAGGHVGHVGVSHDVALPGEQLLFSHVHLHGGPAHWFTAPSTSTVSDNPDNQSRHRLRPRPLHTTRPRPPGTTTRRTASER